MKVASVLITLGLLILVVFFIPPENGVIILSFITLMAFISFQILKNFLRKKTSALISLFIASLLILLSLGLFDIINLILITSLFIGIAILLK